MFTKIYPIIFILLSGLLSAARAETDKPLFTEVTAALGLPQMEASWSPGTHALPEVIGSGVALFDYNNDGALDVLHIRFPPPGKADAPAPNQLFQQQFDGTYVDVTAATGIGHEGYGQGVAIGDVDNDGDVDVYVTNYGVSDVFYRNNGDATFALKEVGLSNEAWGTSATFGDYDRDGDLDLYVANYVQFDPEMVCRGKHSAIDYCNPKVFEPATDRLFQNNGDGSFTDVTEPAGIAAVSGRGLGVVCLDLTGDGWADFFVANDGEANHLWVNQTDGTFAEEAILHGLAFNAYGQPEGSMGIAVGDINGDTFPDLFATHLSGETNTLYIASNHSVFTDMTEIAGFAGRDLRWTGFGCGFLDFDNDADLDIALVNGRVKRGDILDGAAVGAFWNFYAEPNLLFRNSNQQSAIVGARLSRPHGLGNTTPMTAEGLRRFPTAHFTDVSAHAPDFTERVEVSRGMAFGDIDRDGDIDMVVSSLDNRLRVFRNDAPPPQHHYLFVQAITRNRDALGAQVTLRTESRTLTGYVLPGSSYLSSSEPIVHFGLGTIDAVQAIEVRWPDGSREKFPGASANQRVTVYQGKGMSL
ncbi:CRTAC1 family protein [Candidatus Poribacteria bacterium]|nr:CRTAC1 family protein [Candidatus Poribacteria bacterium]MYG06211.1 CRTAC1 family protein [Candidatus Poribacteria bacterium]MYK21253.1 CRTAC1 family protein [Candidatus Poribacteria bacterium]